jgi:hypothetical protein
MARLMPLDFNIYSESATCSDVYYMGPHQQDRQFALTYAHNSFSYPIPKTFLIIHDGLTKRDPAIGTSTNAWVKGCAEYYDDYIITAPSTSDVSSGSQPVKERLVAVHKGTYWHPVVTMRYSVPGVAAAAAVGGSGDGSGKQEFEWQESRCREVLSLGGESRGWRLIALADESEILAVMAPNGNSLTKFLRFSFIGRGRMTDYGTTWEVMAVLTGLTTWNRHNQD